MIGDEFYLQDSRSYVGNDMVFWAISGNGYTTDMRNAQVYTRAEAQAKHDARETDIPWPKDYIDDRTRPAVDMQYVKRDEALADAGIELRKPVKPRREVLRCERCGVFLSQLQLYTECQKCFHENRP